MVVVVPHCPAVGVNVYTCGPTVDVLMIAGDQVPAIGGALVELRGKTSGVVFWQNGPNGVNVGVGGAVMVIFMVAVVPHWPAVGVNV